MEDEKKETNQSTGNAAEKEKEGEGKEKKQEKQNEVNEAQELKERLLRLAAEFDNYKKRVKNDIDAAKVLGKAEMAKNILPVLDEFELAIMALDNSAEKDDELAKGIAMIYTNFIEALKKEGIEEIDAKGKFDPYRHEIVMTKESDKEDGTILEVVKKGYALSGLLIRPASVIVSKKTQENKKQN
ncbi:MAG: nucleotide exchange factor GrpE [Candidatus Micrarchaeia archaeon]